MPKHIADYMGLQHATHANIDFVNISTESDNRLFIDPWLIETSTQDDQWSYNCHKSICSYTDQIYNIYRNPGSNDNQKLDLFQHVHEINATRMGYGNGYNGKAKTPQGMMDILQPLAGLFRANVSLNKASDMSVLIKGFAEDCLSDMITNVTLNHLGEFTKEQCEKHHVSNTGYINGHYWNAVNARWTMNQIPCLLVADRHVLLVPKRIVRNRHYFNASQYFTRIILKNIQTEMTTTNNGKMYQPSIGDLIKTYKGERGTQECVSGFTSSNPKYLVDYHNELAHWYLNLALTDTKLDVIVGLRDSDT